MEQLLSNPLFGIILSIGVYQLTSWLRIKTKSSFCNPLLLSIFIIIFLLVVLDIPLDSYQQGGNVISMFLAPATTVLSYSIYKQFHILKKHFLPIACGCFVGSITSMSSAYLLSKLFGLEETLARSFIPKSVTTPIAMEISKQLGGTVAITVSIVVITGIMGAIIAPFLIKLLHIKNPVAIGVAIGTSSHAVGTTKAVELGEIEGAMSGIAIGISGIITVILSLFLLFFL